MNDSTTTIRLLGAIQYHLSTFRLPARIATVTVGRDALNGEQVIVHLRPVQLAELAAALLDWADTLTGITVTAWRPQHGRTVHLNLTGQLPDATSATVFGGIDYTEALFGDLQPEGRQGVALSILRAWAAGETTVAA
ncbi:hypothetical protein [Actinophytocola sp.]|uniref:hypothetical protein n=1 Tax=Actinophytocola sp. TaxID=1872138 RepID=UPI00389B1238